MKINYIHILVLKLGCWLTYIFLCQSYDVELCINSWVKAKILICAHNFVLKHTSLKLTCVSYAHPCADARMLTSAHIPVLRLGCLNEKAKHWFCLNYFKIISLKAHKSTKMASQKRMKNKSAKIYVGITGFKKIKKGLI